VRSAEGHELKLPSWQEWSARDPLQQRAVEQMVLGVSTSCWFSLRGAILLDSLC